MTSFKNSCSALLAIFAAVQAFQPGPAPSVHSPGRQIPLLSAFGVPLTYATRKTDGALPCGATARLNVNETLYIEGPSDSPQRPLTSTSTCKWRFLFQSCRLAIACPAAGGRSLRSNECDEYLEIRQKDGSLQKVCYGRSSRQLLDVTEQTEVTYRTTATNLISGLGMRCRLTCGGASEVQNAVKPDETPLKLAEPTNCTCGLSGTGTKIVNGIETGVNEYRWMVGLVRVGGSIPFCGASLINSKYILTAAHCVSGRTPKNLEVILNDHNTHHAHETKMIRKRVEAIIPHSSYTNRLDYDAALIKIKDGLEKEMEEGQVVPVCLPNVDGLRQTYEGQSVTVSGWGVTSESGPLSPVLKKTDVRIVTDKACHLSYPGSITSRMMCAAAPMKDACQGDSGGPLVHNNGSQFTQVGIVSWGHGCARPNKPGVYSRVTEFMSWILRSSADGSLCLTKADRIKLLGTKKNHSSAEGGTSGESGSGEHRTSIEVADGDEPTYVVEEAQDEDQLDPNQSESQEQPVQEEQLNEQEIQYEEEEEEQEQELQQQEEDLDNPQNEQDALQEDVYQDQEDIQENARRLN